MSTQTKNPENYLNTFGSLRSNLDPEWYQLELDIAFSDCMIPFSPSPVQDGKPFVAPLPQLSIHPIQPIQPIIGRKEANNKIGVIRRDRGE